MKVEFDLWTAVYDGLKWFIGIVFSGIAFLVGMYIKKLNDLEKQNTDLQHEFKLYKIETDLKMKDMIETLDHIDRSIKQWKNGMKKFLEEVERLESKIEKIEQIRP